MGRAYSEPEVGEGTEYDEDDNAFEYFFIQRQRDPDDEFAAYQSIFANPTEVFWQEESGGVDIYGPMDPTQVNFESREEAELYLSFYKLGAESD
jgi:hypothetical protein